MKSLICTVLLLCLLCLSAGALAADAQTMTKDEYCFCQEDFSGEDEPLRGIFITQVPEPSVACVMLGNRTIRAGDVLTAKNLEQLRLQPCCTESCDAALCYMPMFGDSLGEETQFTVRIQSGKNEVPKAVRLEFETYKNIANDGRLSGTDPENAPLTYQLADAPRLGSVRLEPDGAFVYTPEKNKVGEDSFTFTVTDDAGNVSAPATVHIRILKPSEAMTFADLAGSNDQFEAMWLCSSGLSGGRSVAGTACFFPKEPVSRAEFLIMAMKLFGTPTDSRLTISGFSDAQEASAWVQPYLAAAVQHGLISGEVCQEGLLFRPNDPITGQEAAVLMQRMMKLPVQTAALSQEQHWAQAAIRALQDAGLHFEAGETALTRLEAAKLLRQVSRLLPPK